MNEWQYLEIQRAEIHRYSYVFACMYEMYVRLCFYVYMNE